MRNRSSISLNKKTNNLHRFIAAASTCLERTTFDKLTVWQIVSEAGLSRQTFYRCCNNKFDLLNRYISELIELSFNRAEKEGAMSRFPEYLVRQLEPERELFAAAGISGEYESPVSTTKRSLYNRFMKYVFQNGCRMDRYQEDLLDVYCEAFVYILRRWCLHDIEGDSADIAARILDMMPVKIKKILLL